MVKDVCLDRISRDIHLEQLGDVRKLSSKFMDVVSVVMARVTRDVMVARPRFHFHEVPHCSGRTTSCIHETVLRGILRT